MHGICDSYFNTRWVGPSEFSFYPRRCDLRVYGRLRFRLWSAQIIRDHPFGRRARRAIISDTYPLLARRPRLVNRHNTHIHKEAQLAPATQTTKWTLSQPTVSLPHHLHDGDIGVDDSDILLAQTTYENCRICELQNMHILTLPKWTYKLYINYIK